MRARTRIIGAFVEADVWGRWTASEADATMSTLASFGVTAIVTEAEVYRDDLIDQAHERGLLWIGGVACFSDHAHGHQLLIDRPGLWPIDETGRNIDPIEWYLGITPTFEDHRAARIELMEQIVQRHDLDGIFLDFVRWPVHWELAFRPDAGPIRQASFDAHTLARFEMAAGIRIPSRHSDTAARAAWILQHHSAAWVDFKCATISDFVQDAAVALRGAVDRAFTIGLFALPGPSGVREAIAGQRLGDLARHVDVIAPMAYHAMLHRPVSWVRGVIEEASTEGADVLPVLQVDSADGASAGADWGPAVSPDEWGEVVRVALAVPGVRGLIAFLGTSLLREGRGERMRAGIGP